MFSEKYNTFLGEFGNGRKMVLSTADNNSVSSRMMSVVQAEGVFYFQTDKAMRKYKQLTANNKVALCTDNIQIEGIAEAEGRPLDHPIFGDLFKKCFKGSYDAYSSLENEVVFSIRPVFVQRWIYVEGVPYIEKYNIIDQRYTMEKYDGK